MAVCNIDALLYYTYDLSIYRSILELRAICNHPDIKINPMAKVKGGAHWKASANKSPSPAVLEEDVYDDDDTDELNSDIGNLAKSGKLQILRQV